MDRFIVPRFGFFMLIGLATLLIGVIVRSPDTHGNIWNAVSPDYTRTEVAVVGEKGAGEGLQAAAARLPSKVVLALPEVALGPAVGPMAPGKRIYIQAGCATCHGVDAEGGPVGPPLAGSDPKSVTRMIREGPAGMPAYSSDKLSDADLGKLTTYLQGLKTAPKLSPEELAALARLTYDPTVPTSVLLKGKADLRRSCGGCHTQPNEEEIRGAFASDFNAMSLVAAMAARKTNLNFEDARAIANYMLALRNGANPVKEP